MLERQTAIKVQIKDLTSGAWVEKEGMEPSFVVTPSGSQVARARILGTVMNKFISEDENFASATIDDSTDTIRAKTFKTTKPIAGVEVGDIVDAIGKVRQYNGEVYIIPEILRKVENPNEELLRRLEILKAGKQAPPSRTADAPKIQKPAAIPPVRPPEIDRDALRKEVLAIIGKAEKGMLFSEILKMVKAPQEITELVINDLLSEGMCYEPSPGKIRKI